MDPLEWERLADQAALDLGSEISQLESMFWPDVPGGSFRSFWPKIKDLNERVRAAPAIKLDDKLRLQHQLNELCQRARMDGKRLQEEREAQERELRDALALARETLEDASSVEDIQEVRADLGAIRGRVTALTRQYHGPKAQELWSEWQTTNQAAWSRLNEIWKSNEDYLGGILDEAEGLLVQGSVREAKESIKRFHAETATHPCSHRALRTLRDRAGSLWERANELGREEHARYLEQTSRRMQQWRGLLQRHQHARSALQHQIDQLERQSGAAGTQVAAALLRGQLEQARRELAHLEAEDRDLERRLQAAEVAVEHA